jgi:hypothetical protein
MSASLPDSIGPCNRPVGEVAPFTLLDRRSNAAGQAGLVYAGNPGTASLAHANSSATVSQYDVACVQLSFAAGTLLSWPTRRDSRPCSTYARSPTNTT